MSQANEKRTDEPRFTESSRLRQQIEFIVEIDKAKGILRQSHILDQTRRENDAEHSWHLAIMALLLQEHAQEPVDIVRVVKMTLVHDIVEIDAGDTMLYDQDERTQKHVQERKAAQRIFGKLPADQRDEYIALWEEFEERQTPEAKFAGALDRLQPLLANYHTQGSTWREHDVKKEQVLKFNAHMQEGSSALWAYAQSMIEDAVSKGYLQSEA